MKYSLLDCHYRNTFLEKLNSFVKKCCVSLERNSVVSMADLVNIPFWIAITGRPFWTQFEICCVSLGRNQVVSRGILSNIPFWIAMTGRHLGTINEKNIKSQKQVVWAPTKPDRNYMFQNLFQTIFPSGFAITAASFWYMCNRTFRKEFQITHFGGRAAPRFGGTMEEQLRNHQSAQKCSRSTIFPSGCEYRTLAWNATLIHTTCLHSALRTVRVH